MLKTAALKEPRIYELSVDYLLDQLNKNVAGVEEALGIQLRSADGDKRASLAWQLVKDKAVTWDSLKGNPGDWLGTNSSAGIKYLFYQELAYQWLRGKIGYANDAEMRLRWAEWASKTQAADNSAWEKLSPVSQEDLLDRNPISLGFERFGQNRGRVAAVPQPLPRSKPSKVDDSKIVEHLQSQIGNSPQARFELGVRYLEGRGVEQQEGTGWGYIQSAADAGYKPAVEKIKTRNAP